MRERGEVERMCAVVERERGKVERMCAVVERERGNVERMCRGRRTWPHSVVLCV